MNRLINFFKKITSFKNNGNKKTCLVIFILLCLISIIKSSYSYFVKSDVIKNFSMIVSDLEYDVFCDTCSDGKIVLNKNTSKIVNLNLINKNPIDTKYELYYKVITEGNYNDSVTGGHLVSTEEVIDTVIGKNSNKRVSIVLNNNSDTQLILEIGLKPSLIYDEANLEEDQISLNKIVTPKEEGIVITSVEKIDEETTDIDTKNTTTRYFYQNKMANNIVLSKTNPASSVTYKVTIYNYSNKEQFFIDTNTSLFKDNKNITYTKTGITTGDKIASGEEKTFYIKFHYLNNEIPSEDNSYYIEDYNVLDVSVMDFEFSLNETQIVNTPTYYVYNSEQKVPMVINNNNNHSITGVVSYNGTKLTDEITINKEEVDYLTLVDISSIYNDLEEGLEYNLDFEITSPYNELHTNAVSIIKEKPPVSITNIETYINDVLVENDTVSYTEKSIIVDNSLDKTNQLIAYRITVKNNTKSMGYKFRNITDIFNSNEESSYFTNIDLASDIIINPETEYTFDISYQYDGNNSDNSHKQILEFEFKTEFQFEGTTQNMISFSIFENSSSENYGDFGVIESNFTSSTMHCTYETCYSDNNGDLIYDENGALILDGNNAIALLNIDQSMSVEDEYSVYFTVKGDTSQSGVGEFPSTILAISEGSTKYLTWIGFYKNYLHVYSYYNGSAKSKLAYRSVQTGFISFDISEYSNKIMNLQIVGTRGGNTDIYINGTRKETITSGVNPVSYTYATIGDLRPGRNLKFTGVIYDMGLYNRALSEEEVQLNWDHANTTWGIDN